jgi:hypothetical protein
MLTPTWRDVPVAIVVFAGCGDVSRSAPLDVCESCMTKLMFDTAKAHEDAETAALKAAKEAKASGK